MPNLLITFIVLCLCLSLSGIAQDYDPPEILLEQLIEHDGEESNPDTYTELLEDLVAHPVVLNSATSDDIDRLFFLTLWQRNAIREHLKQVGTIQSIYELLYLPCFNQGDIQKLMPYVSIDGGIRQSNRPYRHQFILQANSVIEEAAGYRALTKNAYLGGRIGTALKYKADYKQFSWGLTADKDPGEPMFKGDNPYGYDFYAGYLRYEGKKYLQNLQLGNYRASFGQGLAIGQGFYFGKSGEYIMRSSEGLFRYNSINESNYLRGIATKLRFRSIDVHMFYSYKPLDGTIKETDSVGNTLRISTLYTDGYHRTASEMKRKHSIYEHALGGNLQWNANNYHIGLSSIYYAYNHLLSPDINRYNYYYFRGRDNLNVSLDFRIRFRNTLLFGEHAIDGQLSQAFLYGIQQLLKGGVSLHAIYRNYHMAYHAHHAAAIGENSSITNESGLIVGLNYNSGKYSLTAHADFFQFPYLKSTAYAPTKGKEFYLNSSYNISLDSLWASAVNLRFRYKQRQVNYKIQNSYTIVDANTTALKLRYSQNIGHYLNLKTQAEYQYYTEVEQKLHGYFLAQDVIISLREQSLRLMARYAYFNTNYDTRIYAYENDYYQGYSMPSHQGKGSRIYTMLEYHLPANISLRAKYSVWLYDDRTSIGSSLTTIAGRMKQEVRLQVVWKWR